MEKFWLIGIPLFLVTIFLYWRITKGYAKKEYGQNMWKQWGTRTFYWQGALLISGGVTVMIVVLLKWANVLSF